VPGDLVHLADPLQQLGSCGRIAVKLCHGVALILYQSRHGVRVQTNGAEGCDKRERHSEKGLRPLARQVPNREAKVMRVREPRSD
jgi:hypothetical protein